MAAAYFTPPRAARRPSAFRSTTLDALLQAQPPPPPPRPLDLPGLPPSHGYVCTLDGVLSPAECGALVSTAEALSFVPALLNVGGEQVAAPNFRRSLRVNVDSVPFATQLWSRLSHAVPPELDGRRVVGLNERLRILKYGAVGDFFAPHQAGHFVVMDGASSSLLTVLLYLNEGYQGARTTFFLTKQAAMLRTTADGGGAAGDAAPGGGSGGGIEVEPKTGSVAIQDQTIWHSVPPLVAGVKYVLRTEVMYAASR